ncbi:class I adenylate-forming enzyme family protein [Methanolacinia paynteri]|uniref:class I adenylate-forming enzyme family protein n=1 Tax=Methanolacinia paynteri TaxID=230356 RepID=UPI00064E8D2B|nr:class I adenylate-forming enzyme family protein [Methanolacinia paynteri]
MPNCTTFIDNNLRLRDKPALICPSQNISLTYGDLFEAMNRYSGILVSGGIEKGDRVCIYLPSSPEYLIFYLAIWRIGAVAVPLNIVLKPAEVRYMLENSGAKAIISDISGSDSVREALSNGPNVVSYVTGSEEWNEMVSGAGCPVRPVDCDFNDLCQFQYTSGTTGKQKGAMLSHGNWISAMDAECDVLSYYEDDVYLGIYPMAHVGVSWGISALRAGATWVVMEKFELEEYIDLIERYSATVVAGMPPVIHSLLKTPPGTEDRLKSAREMISGGGPLHHAIWKEFYSRFRIPVVNAYGLSETIVVGTGTAIRPEDYRYADEFRSVGKPVGYSELKIVDVNDPSTELEHMETGEIALRGPAVACGYWGMEEETKSVFLPDGWFLTGDIGHIDEDGMLSITDRKKDMIVMSGWKIYPTEVEKTLIENPAVDDIAVFGCSDIHRGEVPVAAVVMKEGYDFDRKSMDEFARSRLAGYKVPREYYVVDSLPRVSGWKLLRRELVERYCGNN